MNLQKLVKGSRRFFLCACVEGEKRNKKKVGGRRARSTQTQTVTAHVDNVSFLYFLLHLTLHGRNSPLVWKIRRGTGNAIGLFSFAQLPRSWPHGGRMRRERIPAFLHRDVSVYPVLSQQRRLGIRNPANTVAGASQCTMDMVSLICMGSGGFPGLEPASGSCPVAVRSTNLPPADRPDTSVTHEVISPRHEPYEPVEDELPSWMTAFRCSV